jgi:hypothetical protein
MSNEWCLSKVLLDFNRGQWVLNIDWRVYWEEFRTNTTKKYNILYN